MRDSNNSNPAGKGSKLCVRSVNLHNNNSDSDSSNTNNNSNRYNSINDNGDNDNHSTSNNTSVKGNKSIRITVRKAASTSSSTTLALEQPMYVVYFIYIC